MIFTKSVDELIKLRHSVRSYESKDLPESIIEKINKYIDNLSTPFNGKVRIKIIKKSDYDEKLGTYGVIRGAMYFLAVACEKGKFDLETLGYTFEKVILYCTSLGLGTVWLGGTFNKAEFSKVMQISENEFLPIVSPFGYENNKKSIMASIFGNNTGKRKDYSKLFFENDFNMSLLKNSAGEYSEVLEMVRLAPSALNKQPWRIVKNDNVFHFYMEGNKESERIGMGIAMCHFELSAEEKCLNGKFEKVNPNIDTNYNYVISWICK